MDNIDQFGGYNISASSRTTKGGDVYGIAWCPVCGEQKESDAYGLSISGAINLSIGKVKAHMRFDHKIKDPSEAKDTFDSLASQKSSETEPESQSTSFMASPIEALACMRQIILDASNENASAKQLSVKATAILDYLESAAQEKGFGGYVTEKLNTLRWHTDAAFGSKKNNGHSEEQHRVWALGEINALKGPHCFGRRG